MKETLEQAVYQNIGLAANEQGIINQALSTANVLKVLDERMYSEEEVIVVLTERCKHFGTSVSPFNKLLLKQDLVWFEQFKKK